MTLYRHYQPALYPTALAGPYGTSWGASQGEMKDRVVTLAIDAVDAGLVLRCPADAVHLLGDDVQLAQYPAEEVADYRVRIAGAWEAWVWAGTERGLASIVRAGLLVVANPVFFTARDWPMGRPDLWARWWLIVGALETPFSPDGAWDDAGTWGDGGTWDSDASLAIIASVRQAFRQFTNARDRGWVRFLFGTTDHYDDGGIWDGGAATDLWNDEPAFFEVEI